MIFAFTESIVYENQIDEDENNYKKSCEWGRKEGSEALKNAKIKASHTK